MGEVANGEADVGARIHRRQSRDGLTGADGTAVDGMRSVGRVRLLALAAAVTFFACACFAAQADAFIYWSNGDGGYGSGTIGRANLDGSGVNNNFITGAGSPYGVTVDGQYVYWADETGDTIGRANLDGSDANDSFITGANHPYGVAVNGQYIYWGNQGTATIGRANLDGSSPDESFITAAGTPLALAVDGHYIYWADDYHDTIGRANLDGSSPNDSFMRGRHCSHGVGGQQPARVLVDDLTGNYDIEEANLSDGSAPEDLSLPPTPNGFLGASQSTASTSTGPT